MRIKHLYDDFQYISRLGSLDNAANNINHESLKIIYEYCPAIDQLQNFCRSITRKIRYAVELNRNRTGEDSWKTELVMYDNPFVAGTFNIHDKQRAQNIDYLITQTQEKVAAVETHESIHALSDVNARRRYNPQKYLRMRQALPIEIIEGCTEGWNDYIWNQKSNTYVQYKEIVYDIAQSFGLESHTLSGIYKNGHYGLLLGLLLLYQNRNAHYQFFDLKHLSKKFVEQIKQTAEKEILQYPTVLRSFNAKK